ncbi:hypothetical protein RRF57_009927 [Xylaria bambusicola]|uniref:Uncharacterized protein n=1 Tax=Xylaria bambusicola TaxID=326684 RepID=A0AAN7URG3_9PEZI
MFLRSSLKDTVRADPHTLHGTRGQIDPRNIMSPVRQTRGHAGVEPGLENRRIGHQLIVHARKRDGLSHGEITQYAPGYLCRGADDSRSACRPYHREKLLRITSPVRARDHEGRDRG